MSLEQSDIRLLERQRYDAMTQGDVQALDRLLSENVYYVHSHGGRDTKATYLRSLAEGSIRYLTVDFTTEEHLVTVDSVVLTGTMAARVQRKNTIREVRSATSSVWAKEADGQWRLQLFQATST